jgi:hypothetical protein
MMAMMAKAGVETGCRKEAVRGRNPAVYRLVSAPQLQRFDNPDNAQRGKTISVVTRLKHIIDYGHTARPPASPTTRAVAKAALAATLATRRAHRRGLGCAPGPTVTA